MSEVVLELKDLKVHFPIFGGKILQKQTEAVRAVDGVSLQIHRGEIVGLVGESGSGKTTVARAILNLVEKSSGKILFCGQDLDSLSERARRGLAGQIQAVFQDPYLSLNPRIRVGNIIAEGIDVQKLAGSKQEREETIMSLMQLVGLDTKSRFRFPAEFSAGQRQRIAVARALAVKPKFLICDEPVSSLDVSVQDQILKLLLKLKDQFGLTYLFITHDLAVAHKICDRIAVMHAGKVVELASSQDLFRNPQNDYTKTLLNSIPIPDPRLARSRKRLK